ncbi:hypothetical protein D3C81_2091400 [compost metagenome]
MIRDRASPAIRAPAVTTMGAKLIRLRLPAAMSAAACRSTWAWDEEWVSTHSISFRKASLAWSDVISRHGVPRVG